MTQNKNRITKGVMEARKWCWSDTPVHEDGECCWCDYLRDEIAIHNSGRVKE